MTMTEEQKAGRGAVFSRAQAYLGDAYNPKIVAGQISKFLSQGMDIDTICRTLDYFYGVRHSDPSASRGGIGIVPYVVQEARDYYERLAAIERDADMRGWRVNVRAAKDNEAKVVQVQREPVTRPRSWNSFDLT